MDQLGNVIKSAVVKRSLVIHGRKTSVSLENEFWPGLREIADHENTTAAKLVEQVERHRDTCNLSSAIRVFVFNRFRAREKMNSTGAQNAVMGHSLNVPVLSESERRQIETKGS